MCWALIIAGYVHSNLTEQQGKNPKEILGYDILFVFLFWIRTRMSY